MKIILASKSPRRKELLEQIGLTFEIKVSDVEEKITTDVPCELVEELSRQKAEAVMAELCAGELKSAAKADFAGTSQDILIVGADTVVSIDGRILGKPANETEAAEMLRTLSGRTHQVYTGVTLLYYEADSRTAQTEPTGNVEIKTFHEKTEVTFFPMTEQEIDGYVSTGDCLDKAGAYGIQGFCARYIQGISGDYNNVVGLPVGRLYQEARAWLVK